MSLQTHPADAARRAELPIPSDVAGSRATGHRSARLLDSVLREEEVGHPQAKGGGLQQRLAVELAQQRRLASVGLAVTKISHDLRNLLTSAQLLADRLSVAGSPDVQRLAPRLAGILDRATNYALSVTSYARPAEMTARRRIRLLGIVEEVAELLGLADCPQIDWTNGVSEKTELDADPDQLFRVLLNLMRNAKQALDVANRTTVGRLTVFAERTSSGTRIIVLDDGPGVPPLVRMNLFKPFQETAGRGGTGLGLAIADELVRANGGSIALDTGTTGTKFVICIPDLEPLVAVEEAP